MSKNRMGYAHDNTKIVEDFDIDLLNVASVQKHDHTVSGTAEQITGFASGDVIVIWGQTSWFSLGITKAQAEAHVMLVPSDFRFVRVRVGSELWVDAATSGTLSIMKVEEYEITQE